MYWRRTKCHRCDWTNCWLPELRQPPGRSAGTHSCGRVSVNGTVPEKSAFRGRSRPVTQTAVDGTVQRYAPHGTICSTSRWVLSRQSTLGNHDTTCLGRLFPAELRRSHLFAEWGEGWTGHHPGTAAHHGRQRAQPCAPDESNRHVEKF